ncbi:MAG: GH25 family lysozyme [Minicystis sp.]
MRRLLPLLTLPLLASCTVATETDGEMTGDRGDEIQVCPKATVEGIDVSEFQGNIDWSAVRASGRAFAFIRVADGAGYIDPKFATNWSKAKAAGVARGVYQFFRPGQDGTAQANVLLQHLGGDIGEIAPVVDVEVSDGVSPGTLNTHLAQWIARIQQATGKTPIIYTSPGLWPSLSGSSQFSSATLWVAHWGASCPSVPSAWNSFSFWQYADNGHVPGIGPLVDLDRFNGTLADLVALGGKKSQPRGDLVGVKMKGTGTGGTEVHVLSRDSNWQQFTVHTGTALGATDPSSFTFALGDLNRDGARDLFAVKMGATGTHSTEVHVLSGANENQWLLHTGTPLEQTSPGQWKFAVADHDGDGVPDLYGFKMSGTGTKSTEVHVLSGASNFQKWLLHTGTLLEQRSADNTAFQLADYNGDGKADLIVISMSGTGTKSTEVHILDGASNFQKWLLHTGTPLAETSAASWSFATADVNGDGVPDLMAITQYATTGTKSTEVHVLSGAGNFQSWLVHTGTPLETTTPAQWWFGAN